MRLRKIAIFLLACTVISSKAFTQRYNFITYTTEDGLPQSQIYGLLQAEDRQLWMSTLGGISRWDGKTFYNYTISEGLAANYTINFVFDHQQRAWAISNSSLNLIEGNKISTYPLPATVRGGRARLGVTGDNILWCQINGVLYSFRDNKFAQPDRLVYFIRQHGQAARVRPDMKVVFFQEWETPEERLMGTTEILRQLANLAEDRKAA